MSDLCAALDFYAIYPQKYRFHGSEASSSQAEGDPPLKVDFVNGGDTSPTVVPDEEVCVPDAPLEAYDQAFDSNNIDTSGVGSATNLC